jgi:hypothetical protein
MRSPISSCVDLALFAIKTSTNAYVVALHRTLVVLCLHMIGVRGDQAAL